MFREYNANPKNKKTGDCVIRAISLASGESYETVYRGLLETSLKCGYMLNDQKCFARYLKEHGWRKHCQPRKADNRKYTGSEFSKYLFYKGTALANIGGHHITVIKDGDIWDTWDCSERCIGNYWTKEA